MRGVRKNRYREATRALQSGVPDNLRGFSVFGFRFRFRFSVFGFRFSVFAISIPQLRAHAGAVAGSRLE